MVSTFAEHLGCPVILMGFGLDSDGPHSPNEHFSLDSFVERHEVRRPSAADDLTRNLGRGDRFS